MFGKSFFEIDEEGKPYYITAVYEATIGLFGGKKQEKFVVTDAVTGACEVYDVSKLPEFLFKLVNKSNPFLFLDFEVFAKDWLVCFSPDGVNVKPIVNDSKKLIDLITTKFNDRIIIAYNGNSYDKFST